MNLTFGVLFKKYLDWLDKPRLGVELFPDDVAEHEDTHVHAGQLSQLQQRRQGGGGLAP